MEAGVQRSRVEGPQLMGRPRPIFYPLFCERITSLAVDFLNDGEAIPHAFAVTSGELSYRRPTGLAAFSVFALGGQGSYVNVSSEWRRGRRLGLLAKARAAPGSRKVAGRLFYAELNGMPTIFYKPLSRYRDDRTVILTFRYDCGLRQYERSFELRVKGSGE